MAADLPCSTYRQYLADRRRRLDDLLPQPDRLPDDYIRTVAATLSLSINAADRDRPAGLATPLLQLTSVLDPAGVPTSVLATPTARAWLAVHTSPPTTDQQLHAALRTLRRLCLITGTRD